MRALHRWHERGLGLGGLIVTIVILGGLFLVGAKTVPALVEYKAVVRAANAAAQESSVEAARRAFDAQAAIDDISSITSRDLEISQTGNGLAVGYAYDKEIALIDPVYLLIKFSGRAGN